MGTTFGVKIPGRDDLVEIAKRTGKGHFGVHFQWLNPLGELLDNEVKLIPLDNTAQGIHNVGQVKHHIICQREYDKLHERFRFSLIING